MSNGRSSLIEIGIALHGELGHGTLMRIVYYERPHGEVCHGR